ncbi:MAG: hypothetical protein ACKVQW_04660 [Pyrinomonadaceae bacterium]
MREFDIEQASLHVKWNYVKLLSALPVTGTEAFGVLCDKLAPFGLSASKILLEAPSTKLGDVVLTIILLDGRLDIKFWISSFEIIIHELYEDDEQNVVDIAKIIFEALEKIDQNAEKGTANIRLMYHLKLVPGETAKFLLEHLKDTPQLTPEMAIYQKNVDGMKALQNVRVAFAKSLAYDDALFLDVNLNYSQIDDVVAFKDTITQDVYDIWKDLGLKDLVAD